MYLNYPAVSLRARSIMKKRLVQSQDISQVYQQIPLDFNQKNDWRERGYSNFTNIAWVTPIEAESIMKAFGPAYITQGEEADSFYVTPKYLEPEVEAMIWRFRGTTPIEGNDKTTYAMLKGKECVKCDGTGEVKDEECPRCHGQGEIFKEASSGPRVSVKRDSEWGEWIAQLFDENGKKISTYHTDDKEDAHSTAKVMLDEYKAGKRANFSHFEKTAGKCPTCQGRGSSFNKELNKREKCADCRATGEMTGPKRERIQKEKKQKTASRLIKSQLFDDNGHNGNGHNGNGHHKDDYHSLTGIAHEVHEAVSSMTIVLNNKDAISLSDRDASILIEALSILRRLESI